MRVPHTHTALKEQIGLRGKPESVKQRRKFYKGMQKGFIHSFDNALVHWHEPAHASSWGAGCVAQKVLALTVPLDHTGQSLLEPS